jgi:hypothetical protein
VLWRDNTRSSLDAAVGASTLIPTQGADVIDAEHWRAVHAQVEEAAESLERAASAAPSDETKSAAGRGADALRAAVFAVETDRLLRESPQVPSAGDLSEADTLIRMRAAELGRALEELNRCVNPNRAGPSSPSAPSGASPNDRREPPDGDAP